MKAPSVVFGMPRAAIQTGGVKRVVPLHQIAEAIIEGVKELCKPIPAQRRRPENARTPTRLRAVQTTAQTPRRVSDLDQYKSEQTYRRIYTMMERAGYQKFTDYFNYLASDDTRLRAFIDRLAINVSELFRNPEQFEILRVQVLPELLKRSLHLKLWSAGSLYGAEAYSLAILVH